MNSTFETENILIKIAMTNKNYKKADEILKLFNTQFTINSITNEIVDKVVELYENEELDEIKELVECINESNTTGKSVEEVKALREIERRQESRKTERINRFFSEVKDPNNKERLYILIGESGVGKSYLIEKELPDVPQYACNKYLDPYSLCYTLTQTESGELAPVESVFLKALKNGGIVFLDEMNELPHDTLMFIQGITDEKKNVVVGGEKIDIHPEFKIIASLNPPSDTDERTPIGDALLGRAVGLVLELTDQIIISRLGCTQKFLNLVRRLHLTISTSFDDVRDLTFRDYQRFLKYDFEDQFQFKVCMGSINNIKNYNAIKETGEYINLVNEIYKEIEEINKKQTKE